MTNPTRTIRRDTRVFISAVTRELGSTRRRVMKAVLDLDCHPVEQRHFSLDHRNLIHKIERRIDSCDVVIHIAGSCHGHEQKKPTPDDSRRSYTQLEYEYAVRRGKRVYVFLIDEGFPADPHKPEPPEVRELQESHRQRLTSTGKDYSRAISVKELDQKIRSLSLKVEPLEEELQQVDQKPGLFSRRALFLLALMFGSIVYLGWRQHVQSQEARKIDQIETEFAERFLQQLLTNKEITAEEARRRALNELPGLVKLPLAEIESLIDRKIAPRANETAVSPLERARAALAKGDYNEVFRAAG